jgi:hypothetical protein
MVEFVLIESGAFDWGFIVEGFLIGVLRIPWGLHRSFHQDLLMV